MMDQQKNKVLKETAVYIHIPFCEHKCIYCDFYSIITKDNITAFLSSVKKEIKNYSDLQSDGRIITSIYFGGGTPSLMSPKYINEILEVIRDRFYVSGEAEITLETNPGTVEQNKLKEFREIGVNRLSIGIQSFDEKELKFLTRIHDKRTAIDTVLQATQVGFKNISIDLIFNLPNQTKVQWHQNLETAVSLPATHISAYSLILERGTILNKLVLDGKVKIQDGDYDADLYETTIDYLLQSGFEQYEVSNFSKQGYECYHNNSYWHYKDYFGFGPSAHSFINGKRYWNYSSLKRYISEIEESNVAVAGLEDLNDQQKLNEYVMLALRSDGIKIHDFISLFGDEWLKEKKHYLNDLEKMNYLKSKDNCLKLTKSGYAVCDEIIKNLT